MSYEDEEDDRFYRANRQNIESHGVTREELASMFKEQEQRLGEIYQQREAQFAKSQEETKVALDIMAARASYNDFDECSKIGLETLQANSCLGGGLNHAENKAEYLYQIGLREKAFRAQQEAAKSHQIEQRIDQNLNQPQMMHTHSSPSGNGGYSSMPDFSSMTDAEFAEWRFRNTGHRN